MAAPLGGSIAVNSFVDSAGPNQPFFAPASGGGGGGGSGSATLSTITIPSGQYLNINNAQTGNFNDYVFESDPGNQFNAFTVYSPANSTIGLGLLADNFGNCRISGSSQVEFLVPISTQALFVSSINGAAPGGGGGPVPANLVVSTVTGQNAATTGDPSKWILQQTSDGSGRTQLAANITDNIGFGTYPFIPVVATPNNAQTCAAAIDGTANPTNFGLQGSLIFNDSVSGTDAWIYFEDNTVGMTVFSPTKVAISTPQVFISSLNVSSINGAAPGGGGSVSPDLALSTLTVNGAGFITLDQGATLKTVDDLVIQSDKSGTATARFWTSTTTFTAEAANANNLAIYNPGANPIVESLNLTSQVGGPAVIRCDAGVRFQAPSVAVSSFTVSSINGASYPPAAGAYPKVSTIGLGGGGVQTFYPNISTGSIAQFTDSWTVEAGHLYQVSFNYALAPSTTATYGQVGIFAPVSGALGTQRSVYQDLSISTIAQQSVVVAGQGNGTAYMSFTTNTADPVNLDMLYNTTNVELIDFGPIATSF